MDYEKNDYEREHAKEWQMDNDADVGSKTAEQDADDEDLAEYIQAQLDAEDNPDTPGASEWQQVSRKKQSAKLPVKPPGKIPTKLPGRPPGYNPRGPPTRSAVISSRASPRPSAQTQLPLPPHKASIRPPAPRSRLLPVNPPQPSRLPVQQGPISAAQRARPKVTLTTNNDNLAKAAFRAQHPHTDTFVLARACYMIEPDRKTMYAIIEEMGVRLKSFIRPPQHSRDQTLLLWGDEEQVKATKDELAIWVQHSVQSLQKGGTAFAKASQISEEKARQLDRGYRKEMERQAFQKAPPPNMTFNCTGYFLWPVDEIRPEDLLGPSFEAFDSMRMRHCAYVVFDYHYSVFKIMSDNMDGVKDAISRITGTMKEAVARMNQGLVLHVIEAPIPTDMRKDIKISDGGHDSHSEKAGIPILTGAQLTQHELPEWEIQRREMIDGQFEKTRATLQKGLSRLRLYRGSIKMRVLMGTFALTTFRRQGSEDIPYNKFLDNMNMSATEGRMIKDLRRKASAESLPAEIFSATKLFVPLDVMTTALREVAPIYTAQFTFEIPDTGRVRLELEMIKPGSEGLYERSSGVWTRAKDKFEKNPMEIFMIRLQGGISWALQVSNSKLLDPSRISPTMIAFRKGITFTLPPIDKKPDFSGRRVFTWSRNLPIIHFEQKTTLRFRLASDPRCMFEIARYDSYSGPTATTPSVTEWGASYWDREWDRKLAQNAILPIGKAADWEPQMDDFFPKGDNSKWTGQDAGLKKFIGVITDIVELLDKGRET